MQYYGTRLSDNISKREPEGYLLCLNVPVARTGVQEYLPEELGLTECPVPARETPSGVILSKAEGRVEGSLNGKTYGWASSPHPAAFRDPSAKPQDDKRGVLVNGKWVWYCIHDHFLFSL